MNSHFHALSSMKRWGGKPEDYSAIHDFIDGSKATMPDVRHRALLHNAFGCFIVERVFGHAFKNSEGRVIAVREVVEQHIIDDLGFIPTVQDWLENMPLHAVPWAGGHPDKVLASGKPLRNRIKNKLNDATKRA